MHQAPRKKAPDRGLLAFRCQKRRPACWADSGMLTLSPAGFQIIQIDPALGIGISRLRSSSSFSFSP
jgi:hypothetical protein